MASPSAHTQADREWLILNWTPEHSSFRSWVAGSSRAHEIVKDLLADVEAAETENWRMVMSVGEIETARQDAEQERDEAQKANVREAERGDGLSSALITLNIYLEEAQAEVVRLLRERDAWQGKTVTYARALNEMREALDSTNTTGRCDACGDRIQRIEDDLRPCCGCIRKRPCWHRQWRSTGCAVCIALKKPHDGS